MIFNDRFGEESLHSCEVMLKDVEDSKRINNSIHLEWNKNRQQQLQLLSQQQQQLVDENKVRWCTHISILLYPYVFDVYRFIDRDIYAYNCSTISLLLLCLLHNIHNNKYSIFIIDGYNRRLYDYI